LLTNLEIKKGFALWMLVDAKTKFRKIHKSILDIHKWPCFDRQEYWQKNQFTTEMISTSTSYISHKFNKISKMFVCIKSKPILISLSFYKKCWDESLVKWKWKIELKEKKKVDGNEWVWDSYQNITQKIEANRMVEATMLDGDKDWQEPWQIVIGNNKDVCSLW